MMGERENVSAGVKETPPRCFIVLSSTCAPHDPRDPSKRPCKARPDLSLFGINGPLLSHRGIESLPLNNHVWQYFCHHRLSSINRLTKIVYFLNMQTMVSTNLSAATDPEDREIVEKLAKLQNMYAQVSDPMPCSNVLLSLPIIWGSNNADVHQDWWASVTTAREVDQPSACGTGQPWGI